MGLIKQPRARVRDLQTSEFLADKPELKAQYEKEIAEGNYV